MSVLNKRQTKKFEWSDDKRVGSVGIIFAVSAFVIVFRLFTLMILQHGFYVALASGSQEIYAKLFPTRGEIFVIDSRSGEEYPVAINRDMFLMYADTRDITSDDEAEGVAEKLAEIFEYDDEKKLALYLKINKRDDPYEPIEQAIEEELADKIVALELPGIKFVRRSQRFYPEGNLSAQVVGFLGKNEEGNDVGRYGIEGYWNNDLAGEGGFLEGKRGGGGGWIPLAGRFMKPSQDGVDIVLTIDRTLQFKTCQILEEARELYGAQKASLVIMEPQTGAILAMCSLPDFDLNNYTNVEAVDIYNNQSIFTPYEPGSVFKPLVMAAAINEEKVGPNTVFHDTGFRDDLCQLPIKNADGAIYGEQTMTGVLENSINTGMVFVAEQLGKEKLIEYIEEWGFGISTGIKLDTETPGTIETLYRKKGNEIGCYGATASFGQGIMVTPMQMITAFNSIANGGNLMRPYVVKEVRHADGQVEETKPQVIRQILEKRATSLTAGMLVRVIDTGQGRAAAVPGYYVAGKTGTAQIADRGGYSDFYNHTFIGFAPVDDPKFIMLVKLEKPEPRFSSVTAAPTFGKIAKFILQYYDVVPSR